MSVLLVIFLKKLVISISIYNHFKFKFYNTAKLIIRVNNEIDGLLIFYNLFQNLHSLRLKHQKHTIE